MFSRSSSLVVVGDDGHTDLIGSLEDAHNHNPSAEILIEADSVLEPIAVAELFYLEGDEGEPPDDRFEIASSVTVVDGRQFLSSLAAPRSLIELDLQYDEVDERTDIEVMVEQVEFCDVIVLNRVSDLERDQFLKVKSLLEWLNPRAQILEVPGEGVSLEFIDRFWRACELTSFDFDDVAEGAGWIQVLAGTHPKQGTKIEGLSENLGAVALRGRRPLHPTRFNDFLKDLNKFNVVRAKGWIWISTRNGETGLWSVSGPSSRLAAAGAWMAATPMREWPEDPLEREEIMAEWVAPYGDRRQELTIMGYNLNELELRRAFKSCMLTDEEFALGPDQWAKWADPLPEWTLDDVSDFDGLLQ